ncbi:hypothetical protein [Leifsonia shinshuensis]|uniref:Uncharacterized protein n=1 Tax=Leifsonia shinshuensis TaxID=150026 RepID=A0A7G6YD99_9MICO|nr:hypothetical protein [Leifsonia shinshuensis]QNE36464.1 hypothetical protein F1C12_15995 [Leifsonia shinshuensis]
MTAQSGPDPIDSNELFDWVLERFLVGSNDFGWLIPLLFGVVLALGVSARFGERLNQAERRDLFVSTAVPVVIASLCIQMSILAIVARTRGMSMGVSAIALHVSTIAIVVVSIEAAKAIAWVPLTNQVERSRDEIKRMRQQYDRWSNMSESAPLTRRVSLIVQALGLLALGAALSVMDATAHRGAGALFGMGAVFGGGASAFVSMTRIRTTTDDRLRTRAVAQLLIAFIWCLWLLVLALMLSFTVLMWSAGSPLGGTAILLGFGLTSASSLWTGRRSSGSFFASLTVGGAIRRRSLKYFKRQVRFQKRSIKRVQKELERRATEVAVSGVSSEQRGG